MSSEKLSQKTIKLLRKVIDAILEEPRRLDMESWGHQYPTSTVKYSPSLPPCGTQGCIAGWVRVLGDKTFLPSLKQNIILDSKFFGWDTPEKAKDVLRLTDDQADRLFFFRSWEHHYDGHGKPVGWPKKFEAAYKRAKTPLGKAKATARRIEHFIATNGAE